MPRRRIPLSDLFQPLGAKAPRERASAGADGPAVEAIWHVVCAIPRGQVASYGDVARAAGLPGRARLTGYALRVAPQEMNLPWHRVVGAGGRIVFAKASRGYREQARRLREEGVLVHKGRVQDGALAHLDPID